MSVYSEKIFFLQTRMYMDTAVNIPAIYLLTGCNASGAGAMQWHYIDWGKVTQTVKSLQIRLSKAVLAKKWHKVKRLQWLITHNFAAKLLAIRRVTENKGKRTAGIDGQTFKTASDKRKAVFKLGLKGYKPKAVRRIYIPKSNGKKRPLGIPTMHDRAMQALYLQGLDPVSETTADDNSYGFRPHRSCADAIARCHDRLSRKKSPQWILEGDIKGCFDNISHEWILKNIPLSKKPSEQWLKAGFIDKRKLFPTISGTPQGSIISPTLANMVLDGLEAHIDKACGIKLTSNKLGRINPKQIHFIRYADDFIVTCSEKDYLSETVLPAIQTFLEPRGLELSADKTHITHIEQGFDFLGQNIRKYFSKTRHLQGTLLIKPSKKNIKTFLDKVQMVIKKQGSVRTQTLIETLTPKIRGWAMYHRHIVAKRIFAQVDHRIFQMTWRWAKRRHSARRSHKRWIKKRYYTRIKHRDWLFFDTDEQTKKKVILIQASDIPIKRHTKIRSKANPYSEKDEPYFELRTQRKLLEKLEGRHLLETIFKRQQGRCAYCGELIELKTGWNFHHIVQRLHGGKETEDNLVVLHPNCHISVHLKKFSFSLSFCKNTAASP